MAAWPFELRHHLHFLARFLNPNLPADVRWLQGYRFLEWHFERGSTKLVKNARFRAFIEKHAGALDQSKPRNRTRMGFLEEIRAIAAHALLADRPTDEDRVGIENAVTNTFTALEATVLAVLNEVPLSGIQFRPNLPPEPAAEPSSAQP